MREEIAYREMREELEQDQRGSAKNDATSVDPATRQADKRDAQHPSGPAHMPTAEAKRAAEKAEMPPGAAKAYEEALERGAAPKGEGRVE